VSGIFDDDVLADPVAVIARVVAAADESLTPDQAGGIVARSLVQRAARRRLAQSLKDHPEVLRTGRPPAPLSAARLLLALREAGAAGIPAPRCGGCGKELGSLRSMRGGDWGCTPCLDKWEDCANCGERRRVNSRDRHGNPRCADCPDHDDPSEELIRLVTSLDPAVTAETVTSALRHAAIRPAGQRHLAWAVLGRPGLLTGDGSEAPAPAVLRFIGALADAGATVVVRPACPRCGQVKALSKLLEGKRVCRNCFARHAAVPCARCGAVREPATRDADGRPLCPNCLVRDPANLEECAGCGRRRVVAVRDDSGSVWCDACRPRQVRECAICGLEAKGEISRATGQPWCSRCQQWWTRCSGCGTSGPVRGGTRREPLCARCVNPDPGFWGRCPSCEQTWQLSTRPCQRCLLAEKVRDILGGKDGGVRPALAPLYQAMAGAERPDSALAWIARPGTRALLEKIGGGDSGLTHEALDELPSGKALAHLRSVLVATGALPPRDERLTGLERWIRGEVARREDPGERRVLHSYATWHHLRKLRQRLRDGTPVTRLQDLNVRCHVTAAANFMDWIAAQGLTLATCAQGDLDRRAGEPGAPYPDETAHFIRWAVKNRHARGLTAGAIRWGGPQGPHDTERRWDDARRLLNDSALAIQDRVAGLLLLLYAQKIATITKLTTSDISDCGATVAISLGTVPVVLPPPLDDLVRDLAADASRGHAAIGRPAITPWLFAGGRPGQPITDDALGNRLKHIGLSPRQDRSTALFALAAELPAAILARMLGIHIAVAVQWQRAAAGDWMAYAADVSRRTTRQPVPSRHETPART
jgi:hypothetical protein